MAGFKALWGWMRAHPVTAALVFLVLIPAVAYGLMTRVRGYLVSAPVVGNVVNKIPQIGA